MKILHVIHSIDTRSGGPSHAIRRLARKQVAAGHDVSLLTTTTQSAEPWSPRAEYTRAMASDPYFADLELSVQRAYGRRRPWNRYAYTPHARRWLRSRLDDAVRRPDVVHIHGTFSHLTTLASRVARSRGVPYILRPAGSLNSKCLAHRSTWLKSAFVKRFLAHDLAGAAAVQAMSASERAELSNFVAQAKVHVVPHGVEVAEARSEERGNPFLARFPEFRGRKVILYLSRIHPKKRPALLVEAVAQLRSNGEEAVLIFAGHDAGGLDDVQRAATSHGLADRVVCCGFLTGAEKRSAFHAASVFALPSIDENFGVAVVEAMAHGTPVLVTPGVASHEYVDASGCGLTVAGTAGALADGLRRLLREDRTALGERGRSFVSERLSWPVILEQVQQMYEEALVCRKS